MIVNILTKNPGKLLVAKNAFEAFNIEVASIDKEYPEIQADTSLEIAKFTALQAAKDLNKPIIREDHSLFITALGIPGPYTHYIEQKISVEKLLNLLKNEPNRNGYFEIATVYAEPNGFTKEHVFRVPIVIALKPSGDLQGGWNRIIRLQGETRTLAEYPEQERAAVWDKGYKAIANYFTNELEKV